MDDNRRFVLDKESDDLVPLPVVHRQGLVAVTVLAALSFVLSTAVLLYLTVKLVRWHLRTMRQARRPAEEPTASTVDLSLGLAEHHLVGDDSSKGRTPDTPGTRKRAHPNQFLVLLYNLLLADIHQAGAFVLNAAWLGHDAIFIRTPVCWAQGWLVSTGDLSSSLFITAIAVHTYLAIVWNYTPPQWAVYVTVVSLWFFNYFMFMLGLVITRNGKDAGGFYVRAAGWCWINIHYENLRLSLHYLWIFISLAFTSILYILIFVSLRRNRNGRRHQQHDQLRRQTNSSQIHLPTTTIINDGTDSCNSANMNTNPTHDPHDTHDTIAHITPTATTRKTNPLPPLDTTNKNARSAGAEEGSSRGGGGHHKAFLLYPVIYVVCTAPLALGRIATMAGLDVPISYFCTAGALIASNGWLDVLLWGLTRHRLLFNADVDAEESGLDTFAFMRTPLGRRYGNLVWVEGGAGGGGRGEGGGGGGDGGNAASSAGGGRGGGNKRDSGRGHRGERGWLGSVLGRRSELGMGWRRLGRVAAGQGKGEEESNGARRKEGPAMPEEGLAIQMDLVTTVVVEPAKR